MQADQAPITDSEDFEILLDRLRKKKLVALLESDRKEDCILRIKLPNEKSVPDITSEHANVFKLKGIHERVQGELDRLSTQINAAKNSAVVALKKQDRSLALHELRRSKRTELLREQRLKASLTIGQIILSIDSARSDSQIFEAYKLGESTLKSILGKEKLNVQTVDDLMVSIQDALAEQNDIATILSGPIETPGDTTDEALEQELVGLISEVVCTTDRLQELPSVPTTEPTIDVPASDPNRQTIIME